MCNGVMKWTGSEEAMWNNKRKCCLDSVCWKLLLLMHTLLLENLIHNDAGICGRGWHFYLLVCSSPDSYDIS
jgi:hypothetical protein